MRQENSFQEDKQSIQVLEATFFAEWVPCAAKENSEKVANWASKRPASTDAGQALLRRAWIMTALGHLAAKGHQVSEADLALYSKPRKAVTPLTDRSKGQLLLYPETTVIKTKERDLSLDLSAASVVEGSPEVTFTPSDEKFQYFVMPCSGDVAAPFWYVGRTTDPALANMTWCYAQVQVLSAHFVEGAPASVAKPKAGRKRRRGKQGDGDDEAGGKQGGGDDEAGEVSVRIPCLVNHVPVEAGSPLVYFQAPNEAKQAKAARPISVTALAKKRREV